MSASIDLSTPAHPLLHATGLGKVYGASRVLDDVTLAIDPGEVVGLIGANGAGKSTLIKCLTGAVAADAGTIRIEGEPVVMRTPDDGFRIGVCAVHQEVALVEDHSVAENTLLGRLPSRRGFVSRRGLRRPARELLRRVQLEDVDPDSAVAALTPAKKHLVMVAAVLAYNPRIVILDEPTAGLPPEESATVLKLVRELSDDGVAVIYVTHRLYEVKELCSRVIALRNGRMSGALSGELVTRENMLPLIGGDAEALASRASTVEPRRSVSSVGEPILEAREISGRRVRNVTLTAHRGEVLGIAGLAGSGRSELLRLIYGLQPLTSGELLYSGMRLGAGLSPRVRTGMGYVAEQRQNNILHGLSVGRNITCAAVASHRKIGVFADTRWEQAAAERMSTRMSLVGRLDGAVGRLSGGNQQKTLIARWLVRDTELLLLDEPTAGVDLVARAEIHQLLREMTDAGKSVIVASVEVDELTVLCDRVIVLVEGETRTTVEAPFTEQQLVTSLFQHRDPEVDS